MAEPQYPGAAIQSQLFIWSSTGEIGDVRIMDYGSDSRHRYRVACFCPGRTVCVEGDTPKTEAEFEHWCSTLPQALVWFDLYVSRKGRDGWQKLTPTGRTMRDTLPPMHELARSSS